MAKKAEQLGLFEAAARKEAKREHYEEKLEAKRERLEARAEKARGKAAAARRTHEFISDMIPFGQPILVGHHSEKRHRRDLDRMTNAVRTDIAETEKAKSLEERAEAVGNGYAISSDNPDALDALREKLARLEANREKEKKANAAMRKAAKAKAKELGRKLTQTDHIELAKELKLPGLLSSAQAFPWLPQYGNHTQATIRNTKQRIAQLEAEEARRLTSGSGEDIEGDGFTIEQDDMDNRIRLSFHERISKEHFSAVRREGFRWSRQHQAFSRHLNQAGRYAAERAVKLVLGIDVEVK